MTPERHIGPIPGGSPSSAKTDNDGRFTLVYSREQRGAQPGEHEVWISTAIPPDVDAEVPQSPTPERVPESYRAPGALKADVNLGSNAINFELISQGTALTTLR